MVRSTIALLQIRLPLLSTDESQRPPTNATKMSPRISQKVAKSLRSMLYSSFLNNRSKFNPFGTLPPESIMAVLAFLPSADQICFSLSCKYTFCCFQSYVLRTFMSEGIEARKPSNSSTRNNAGMQAITILHEKINSYFKRSPF